MTIDVLSITSGFPKNINFSSNLYLWHSLEALKQINVNPVLLNIDSWKPFYNRFIDYSQFPIEIHFDRYFSIPRHYCRVISNFFYLQRAIPVITKILKENQIDIIHAHGEIHGLVAFEISKRTSIPYIITIHGIDTCARIWKGDSGKSFRKVLSEADRLIFVGKSLMGHYESMLSHQDHCRIVYNGFRLPQKLSPPETKNSIVKIISVSNLHEGKGVDLTLRALGYLKRSGITNWKYTIIGSGYQKKALQNIVGQFDLDSHVEFKGNLSHDEVYSHLGNASIFCLPSYREAFGVAYLEAMAHRLIAIGVQGQGPEAFIKHGKTGFLVESENLQSLIGILKSTIANCEKMYDIAEAGRQYVLNNFTWTHHAQKLLTIYKEIM